MKSTFGNIPTTERGLIRIHEFEKFDERMKYVALSRSTDILNINIAK